MAKKASRSPSKGTQATEVVTESPKQVKAVQSVTERHTANVVFSCGESVELGISTEIAEACFFLAAGVKCADSVCSISLTPPRAGRDSVLSVRFITPAAAAEFVKSLKD